MSFDPIDTIRAIFQASAEAHGRFAADRAGDVLAAAQAIQRGLADGKKVLAFGNGGSASDAEHFVAELVGRFEVDRPGLSAIALTADSSVLTSVANDFGYAQTFTRQVEALGRPGDVAFGISTSGQSANVAAGLATARARGLTTIALTGRDGGPLGAAADIHVNVAERSTARTQEVHRTILHAICALIDRAVLPR